MKPTQALAYSMATLNALTVIHVNIALAKLIRNTSCCYCCFLLLFCMLPFIILPAVPEEARRGHHISLALELQAVVRCLMWVLGTELWFSGRSVHTLNSYWAISPALPGHSRFLLDSLKLSVWKSHHLATGMWMVFLLSFLSLSSCPEGPQTLSARKTQHRGYRFRLFCPLS